MGRKSREKRERRRRAESEPFIRLGRSSALAVLGAASLAPSASYRLPTITAAFLEVLRRPFDGRVPATAAHLDELLAGPVDQEVLVTPRPVAGEDFAPLDVRLGVRAWWDGQLFSVIPGAFEAPMSVLQDAGLAAAAFDAHLLEAIGFGVSDLVEIVLRLSDSAITACEETWGEAPTDISAHASITDAEITALQTASTVQDVVASCRVPDRAMRAVEWATRDLAECTATFRQGRALGASLRVDTGAAAVLVPPALFFDVIHDGVESLRRLALRSSPDATRDWDLCASAHVVDRLAPLGPMIRRPTTSAGSQVTAVLRISDSLYLAVDVVPRGGPHTLLQARESLASVTAGASLGIRDGVATIPTHAEVARAVITVGGGSLADLTTADDPQAPVVDLQTIRWMVTTSKRLDDLARFLIDMAESGIRTFSYGAFDEWEVWRANGGTLSEAGLPPDMVMIEPHGESAEWDWYAAHAWLCEGLAVAGLPPLPAWTTVDGQDDSPRAATLHLFDQRLIAHVAEVDGVVVAVVCEFDSDAPISPDRIARAVFWRLRQMGELVEDLAVTGAVRMQVEHDQDLANGSASAFIDAPEIGLRYGGVPEGDNDPAATIEAGLGQALEKVSGSAGRFLEAWLRASPGLAMDLVDVPFVVVDPGPHEPPHPAVLAHERGELALRLAEAAVPTGRFEGRRAVKVEATIAGHLTDRSTQLMRSFGARDIIIESMSDLERLHARRAGLDGHARRRVRLHAAAGTSVDPEEFSSDREDLVLDSRSLALLVETALQAAPSGGQPFSGRDADRLRAAMRLTMESSHRREALKWALTGTATRITDRYEVRFGTAPAELDHRALVHARAMNALTHDTPEQVTDLQPRARDEVDAALLDALGFSLAALGTTLDVLTRWMVTSRDLVSTATASEIIRAVSDDSDIATAQTEAVVEWLTLRGTDLPHPIPHWKVDRRQYRLATRPLVALPGTDELVIGPRSCQYARLVIDGHLSALRTPWGDALPGAVLAVLDSQRAGRNLRFEREVAEVLEAGTDLILRHVKKDDRVGDWTAEREVDLVAVDRANHRIWVLDMKDPVGDLVAQQIRRSLKKYYDGGGYVAKVLGTVDRIRRKAASVAAELVSTDAADDWDVYGGIITRHIESAAFYGQPPVHFMTPGTAATTLTSSRLPDPAYGTLTAHEDQNGSD